MGTLSIKNFVKQILPAGLMVIVMLVFAAPVHTAADTLPIVAKNIGATHLDLDWDGVNNAACEDGVQCDPADPESYVLDVNTLEQRDVLQFIDTGYNTGTINWASPLVAGHTYRVQMHGQGEHGFYRISQDFLFYGYTEFNIDNYVASTGTFTGTSTVPGGVNGGNGDWNFAADPCVNIYLYLDNSPNHDQVNDTELTHSTSVSCTANGTNLTFQSNDFINLGSYPYIFVQPNSATNYSASANFNLPFSIAPMHWNLAEDFRTSPSQNNPSSDNYSHPAVWHYFESATLAHEPASYHLLTNFFTNAFGIEGLQDWHGTTDYGNNNMLPRVALNTTGAQQTAGSTTWPAGAISVHPETTQLVIAGWRSPVTGTVQITGGVADQDATCGGGIKWTIDKGSTVLAEGQIANGGNQSFSAGTNGNVLASVSVGEGEFLYFTVDPNGDYGCDSTGLTVEITKATTQISALAPARVWIGLKNSDDVGTKFDLKAEAYKDGVLVSSGTLDSFAGGSSGFNNAHLATIPFNSFLPVNFPAGSVLSFKVYVRNACVGSGHNSGTARLWFDDSAANSKFSATIGTTSSDYYLRDLSALATTAGAGPKKTIDIQAGAKCSAYKPFATWSKTL